MEHVIHRFPVHDDSEIRLVVIVERGGATIELRRYRQIRNGSMTVQERFPIRLAWVPALVEGLSRAEESVREVEQELARGEKVTPQPSPPDDRTALVILPERTPPPVEAHAGGGAEAQPQDPSRRFSGRFPRFGIRAPLIVAVQARELAGPHILTGDAVDISWGGLQALLPSKLQPGTVLEILVGLGGKKALKLPARVVWERLPDGLGEGKPHGLEFLPADPRLRQLIEQHILQLAQGNH